MFRRSVALAAVLAMGVAAQANPPSDEARMFAASMEVAVLYLELDGMCDQFTGMPEICSEYENAKPDENCTEIGWDWYYDWWPTQGPTCWYPEVPDQDCIDDIHASGLRALERILCEWRLCMCQAEDELAESACCVLYHGAIVFWMQDYRNLMAECCMVEPN